MKNTTLALSVILLVLGGAQASAQTSRISSVSIGTASTAGGTANGVAIVTERIGTPLNQPGSVGDNLAGLQYVPGQIPLDGSPASITFFSLTGAAVPGGAGNPATAFTSYGTLASPTAVTTYIDAASKLTPNSYSGMTFAEANLGTGSRNFYMIHHRTGTDYFAQIVPGTATSTLIADLKPMSWAGPTAGGPASIGTTGYFGLAWATGILSAGAPYADQSIYYLRTDSNSHVRFGVMIPALTGASADTLDLTTAVGAFGAGGYTTLAFSPASIGNYGANQFYYLRLDPITGNTILGRLNPSLVAGVRTISDIANLGGVFNSLNFAADATGPAGAWGSSQFYVAGILVSGAQSVSFGAVPDHNVGDVFVVTPTASSGLDLDVTVVSGPATIQTSGVSGATPLSLRSFTVTTTGPGIVTLQARQAGRSGPLPAYTANLLQQHFNVLGSATLPVIATGTGSASASVGAAFTYTISATGSPTSYAASPLPAGLALNATTGVISGTPSAAATTVVTLTATNGAGTSSAGTLTITVRAAGAAPVFTSPSSASGTAGAPFDTYVIGATGLPTSYGATGLPPGLTVNPVTGTITGTATTPGTYVVTITATNSGGISSATLTIVIAPQLSSRIVNFSGRAMSGSGSQTLILGFVVSGDGKNLLVRGVGPALASLGVLTPLADPMLTLYGSAGMISSDDDWQTGGTVVATRAAQVGAFALPAGSKDSALLATVNHGAYTAILLGVNPAPGVALTEIYDTDAGTVAARLVNASTRANVSSGEGILIAGFVISGNVPKTVLIRGVGPTLSIFGVTGLLADPQIAVFSGGTQIASNDNWEIGASTAAQMAAASAQVGAFPLVTGSRDAALLITLQPGAYTVQVTGVGNTSGVALIEIYDTQ